MVRCVHLMGLTTSETYPLAYGIINTGGQLGGAVFPLAVGMILDCYDWNSVFLFLALSCVLCVVVPAKMNEPVDYTMTAGQTA